MASNRPTNNDLDKSLLDRLNALKGTTSITLDTSKSLNPLNPLSTTPTASDTAPVKSDFAIGPVPSVSKEDALTERLRVLRNASSSSMPSLSRESGQPSTGVSPKPESDAREKRNDSLQSSLQRGQTPVSRNGSQQLPQGEATQSLTQLQALSSAWGLEEVDDQALDELLEGLQDDLNLEEGVLDEEDIDLQAIANNNNNNDGIIENDEDKVQKLLSELAPKPNSNSNSFTGDNGNDDDDDDNSDGEAMTKETNKILNQIHDDLNLNSSGGPEDNDPFSLPSPPSGTRTPELTTSPKSSLSLPTVPLSLPSPPSGSGLGEEEEDPNAITSLTARLSHLRSTPIKTDQFGLPSVPTTTLILPADSSLPSTSSQPPVFTRYQTKSTRGWAGRGETYTDEDVKKWCTVCLEDASIRCEGCEDEGYCVRCWREMHVGVRAGYEERGHRWFRIGDGKCGGGEGWSGPTTPM
ncbi:hypothetical protein B0T20DRAFT_88852 [Sordaria brevicollis]|uniref:Uncharacterized protein n=1 Tax=Sordaria brevicollis TaxID=83679 RepID=A0AAE0NWE4_SORBR|nr:hypothetical protein B0T20DRAFT_88852 [Sordaria brevicollis]